MRKYVTPKYSSSTHTKRDIYLLLLQLYTGATHFQIQERISSPGMDSVSTFKHFFLRVTLYRWHTTRQSSQMFTLLMFLSLHQNWISSAFLLSAFSRFACNVFMRKSIWFSECFLIFFGFEVEMFLVFIGFNRFLRRMVLVSKFVPPENPKKEKYFRWGFIGFGELKTSGVGREADKYPFSPTPSFKGHALSSTAFKTGVYIVAQGFIPHSQLYCLKKGKYKSYRNMLLSNTIVKVLSFKKHFFYITTFIFFLNLGSGGDMQLCTDLHFFWPFEPADYRKRNLSSFYHDLRCQAETGIQSGFLQGCRLRTWGYLGCPPQPLRSNRGVDSCTRLYSLLP